MNNYKRPILVVSIILLLGLIFYMRSCQDKTFFPLDDISSVIPSNAAIVAAVDLPQIFKKIGENDFKVQSSFDLMANKAAIENPIFSAILRDPLSSGIKLDQDAYFVLLRDTSGQERHLSAMIFGIEDLAKYEKLVLDNKSEQFDIISERNFKHVLIDQMTITGWSDQIALIGATSVFTELPIAINPFFNNGKSTDGVNTNKHFVEAMKRDDSFKYWISLEPFSYDPAMMSSMGMKGVTPGLASGNFIIGGIDFLEGKILGEADFKFDLEIQLGINKLFKNKSSEPFYQGFNTENLAFSFFGSLNIPLIYKSAMGDVGAKQLEQYLLDQGFNMQDLFKSLGGDILVNAYHQNDTTSVMDLFITLDITDYDKIDRILTWASKNDYLEKVGHRQYNFKNKWEKGITSMNITGERMLSLEFSDDKLIISNNSTRTQSILTNKSNKALPFYSKLFESNQLAGYFNMRWLSSGSEQAMYDNIEFQFNKDGLDFQFIMLDKHSNALKQILTGK